MICPNCQSNMSDKRMRCERCGQDLTLYKKILRASNLYYNNGLSRAKVRDLSGAVIALKNSLELNKTNTNARNLLGLIYFEMGETVAALSEWVISRYFKPEDNDADEYINAVQENPTKLDGLNQAIKRYNNALTFAKQRSDDLAIIQLKKVVSLNPHFIRAYHLLSLLYMKNNENEKAKKCLLKASKIDVSNTTTLRYLRELEPQPSMAKDADVLADTEKGLTSSIMPVSSYREEKPNIMAFINLVIGVLIGLAVMAVLVIPSIKKNEASGENQNQNDYNAGIAALEAKDETISSLQEENDKQRQEIADLKNQIDGIVIPEINPKLYDPLFTASQQYMDELVKDENDRNLAPIADILAAIDDTQYESEESKTLLSRLKEEIYPTVSDDYYDEGHDLYSDYKYEDALTQLYKAYELDPSNVNAIYFIARSYHRLEDFENAITYYQIVVTDFPDSNRYDDAKEYLDDLLQQAQEQEQE